MNDLKMRDISEMKSTLVSYLKSQLDGKLAEVDTEEAGKVADIIKDLADAEKNCYEACYYKTVIDAMEEGKVPEYENFGYTPRRNSRGQFMSSRMGYKPYMDQEPYVDNYINNRRMMGYVDPNDMESAMSQVKMMWDASDPNSRLALKADLKKMLNDLD